MCMEQYVLLFSVLAIILPSIKVYKLSYSSCPFLCTLVDIKTWLASDTESKLFLPGVINN